MGCVGFTAFTYPFERAVVFACGLTLSVCGGFAAAANAASKAPKPGEKPDVPAGWFAKVQDDLEKSEYNISWADKTALEGSTPAWQAPNRAHNLRTYFTPEGPMSINRTDGKADWQCGLAPVSFG